MARRRANVFPFALALLLPFVAIFAPVAPTAHAATAESTSTRFDHVEVAPAKTSIYVGTVSMTLPAFTRRAAGYESTYIARVFPYFFYNEAGTLRIELPDEQLEKLSRGEPVDFTGRAERTDGAPRRVEGRATPFDARSGKIKVRVFYSPRVELIFNTTYRFK